MSWARLWAGKARGGDAGTRLLQSLLGPIYVALTGLAAQVQAHAQMAPTVSLEEEMGKLGNDIGAQAERIGTLLAQRQLVRPAAGEPEGVAQPNHWARLVQDLEGLREVRRLLLDAYARLNEVDPPLASELEDCSRRVEDSLHRIRGFVARADPQALN